MLYETNYKTLNDMITKSTQFLFLNMAAVATFVIEKKMGHNDHNYDPLL